MSRADGPVVRLMAFDELTARQLHDLLRLRLDVFVVEQACAYPEIDGRDTEPGTRHLWLEECGGEEDGEVVAALRVLRDPDAAVVGRVVTRADRRGHGYAARLVAAALDLVGEGPVRLDAQAHLEEWYARFGFVRTGPDHLEDGIPHLPMALVLRHGEPGRPGTV